MRIASVLFPSPDFGLLCQAFMASAAVNSPNTQRETIVIRSPDPDIEQAVSSPSIGPIHIANARKTRHHRKIIEQAQDGEIACLMDCDTLVLGDLSEVDMQDADLILTSCPYWKTPNTGVYFVRVSDKMRDWMQAWEWAAMLLLSKAEKFWAYYRKYGGVNQGALGWLREVNNSIRIRELPGEIWNCTPDAIDSFSGQTKVLHLKGWLRSACFGRQVPEGKERKAEEIRAIWNQYAGAA